MKYVNAKAVLPYHLVEELQEYIQAGYIYIPAREDRHRAWGEQSGCRRELAERNAGIVDAYRQGVSLEELGDKYCLFCPRHTKNCISEVNHGEPQCAAPFFGRFEWRISG